MLGDHIRGAVPEIFDPLDVLANGQTNDPSEPSIRPPVLSAHEPRGKLNLELSILCYILVELE